MTTPSSPSPSPSPLSATSSSSSISPSAVRDVVLRALSDLAPEADLTTLKGDDDVREALDIDSMDFLKLVVVIHEKLAVDVPEKDYGKIRSLDDCVAYVVKKRQT